MLLKHQLMLRKKTYYFRWQIPVDMQSILGQREIVKSLRTDNIDLAYSRSLPFSLLAKKIQYVREQLLVAEITEVQACTLIASQWKAVTNKSLPLPAGYRRELALLGAMTADVDISRPERESELSDIPLLSEVYQEFRAYKIKAVKLSERQLAQNDRDMRTILALMEDKPLNGITRADVKACLQCALSLPVRIKKPYKDLSIDQLLDMDIPEEDLVKPKTVKQLEALLQGIFRYAIDEGIYVGNSPAKNTGLNLSIANSYAPFSNDEIRRIIQHTVNLSSNRKWIVLLGIYTGARLGELVQLRKLDVKFDEESGRYYLFITRDAGSVKNENAIRKIPIHRNLVEIGFMDYVASCKHNRLFEGVVPKYITHLLNRIRDNAGVEYRDEYGKRKVFHSFRHTVITIARLKGINDLLIKQVVGHQKKGVDVTDIYTHSASLKEVLCVIDCLDF